MVKIVLFDFGGVLTEGGRPGFIGSMVAALWDVPADQVDISDLHIQLRRGKIHDDAFFAELNQRYGGQVTKDMFLAYTSKYAAPSQPVYQLAERLRTKGIRTGILSNVFTMNAEQLRAQGRYDGFDPVILSCEVGYAKPDPEIYEIAVRQTGVAPGEILLIDDQEKCISSATEAGFLTVQAFSPEQIVSDTVALIQRENNIEV